MTAWTSLIPFIGIVALAAVSGAFFMPGEWYARISKPTWTPPNWLFAPAWTVLYMMIAIAGWLVWRIDGFGTALAIWGANLVFNLAWSWLMFGRHLIRAAFVDSLMMLLTIVGFIFAASSLSQTAALLFLPYLAWVVFAAALNFAIMRRNPEAA
jgi:benzodiazapine receptor